MWARQVDASSTRADVARGGNYTLFTTGHAVGRQGLGEGEGERHVKLVGKCDGCGVIGPWYLEGRVGGWRPW